MQRLTDALHSTEQALTQLDAEHKTLQSNSTAEIDSLAARVANLSHTCDELQASAPMCHLYMAQGRMPHFAWWCVRCRTAWLQTVCARARVLGARQPACANALALAG